MVCQTISVFVKINSMEQMNLIQNISCFVTTGCVTLAHFGVLIADWVNYKTHSFFAGTDSIFDDPFFELDRIELKPISRSAYLSVVLLGDLCMLSLVTVK